MDSKFKAVLKTALLFAITSLCLFWYPLRHHSGFSDVFSALEMLFLQPQTQWILFIWMAVWCASFIFLTFSLNDLLLLGLLLMAVLMYAADYATACQTTFALTLLTGITLGKMARLFLSRSYQYHVVLCFVVLLAATSWCHLDMTNGFYPSYHGPRWMGLWNNPNTYGMLMGAGFILSICLLVEQCRPLLLFAYCLAAGLTGLGLLFSCSRGAWCGVVFAVLYMGTVRWKELYYWIVPIGLFAILAAVLFFWNFQTDRWYLKRLDLNRPSCQNRIAAWKGAVQIIRDHPWRGVGWNMTGRVYENHYSPPADGGAAIVTNDYLMLGTELGLPGLLCFMAYVGLALKGESRKQKAETLEQVGIRNSEFGIKTACRAGALVLLVSFWFNSGLFNLPTAMVSWVLLELGAVKSAQARVAGSGSG